MITLRSLRWSHLVLLTPVCLPRTEVIRWTLKLIKSLLYVNTNRALFNWMSQPQLKKSKQQIMSEENIIRRQQQLNNLLMEWKNKWSNKKKIFNKQYTLHTVNFTEGKVREDFMLLLSNLFRVNVKQDQDCVFWSSPWQWDLLCWSQLLIL